MVNSIAMGLDDVADLLLRDPQRQGMQFRRDAFPHIHHARTEVQIPRPTPGDIGIVSVDVVDERARIPHPTIPEGQVPKLWHPQRCHSSFVEQVLHRLAAPPLTKESRCQGERLQARPMPVWQASAHEVLSIYHVRRRELLQVETFGGKGCAELRIRDAGGLDATPAGFGHQGIDVLEGLGKIVAEIFKEQDALEGLGEVLLDQL